MKEKKAVRIIIFNHLNEVLLMQIHSDWKIKGKKFPSIYWITPGGGIDKGETHIDTLIRELKEETGIPKNKIVKIFKEPIWQNETIFENRQNKNLLKLIETFYPIHVSTNETSKDGFTENEKKSVKKLRWWTLDEIKSSKEAFLPEHLFSLLLPLEKPVC